MPKWLSSTGESIKRASDAIGVARNIQWLCITLAALGAFSYFSLRNLPVLRAILATTFAALFVFFLGFMASRALERRRGALGYRVLRADHVYAFDNRDLRRQSQLVTVELQALRDGVCLYEGRYGWSGTGNDTGPVMASANATLIEAPAPSMTGWRAFYIVLNQPLKHRQVETIAFRYDLYDSGGTFRAFLAKTPSHKIDNLSLKVVFPDRAKPRGDTYARQRPANPSINSITVEEPLSLSSQDNSIEYAVKKAKADTRYAIEWDWPEYEAYCAKHPLGSAGV